MEKEGLRHSVQNVVVPFAIMLKVALEITKLSQTDPYENIFPALNEALELCMSKSPADLRNENGGCLKPTLRKNLINDDCLSWSTQFWLIAHRFVQCIRRARGDLVEKFDSGLTWAQIIERARNHLAIMSKLPNANQNCYINL
jgi:hypothetical protein